MPRVAVAVADAENELLVASRWTTRFCRPGLGQLSSQESPLSMVVAMVLASIEAWALMSTSTVVPLVFLAREMATPNVLFEPVGMTAVAPIDAVNVESVM